MTTLTSDDIQNLLTLIDFHDDWDEVKEVWGFDIEPLFDKLHDMLQDSWAHKHSLFDSPLTQSIHLSISDLFILKMKQMIMLIVVIVH